MTPEQKVQNNIINHLKQLQKEGKPIFYEKRQAGGWNYKKGLPDLYIVVNGMHLEFEIKKPNGKPSEMQIMWQRKFKSLRILSFIVDDWKQVEEQVKKFL